MIQELLKGDKPVVLADQLKCCKIYEGLGYNGEGKTVGVANYIASDRVAVERKTI